MHEPQNCPLVRNLLSVFIQRCVSPALILTPGKKVLIVALTGLNMYSMCVFVYEHVYACVCVCVCMCVRARIYIYIYIYIYIGLYVYVNVCMYVCVFGKHLSLQEVDFR
jgi:hypothetical protein